ncbi:unnamed protein product [Effrenium voratum]|nr:unnamed protein product [Effrenium voratum]
MCSSRSWAVGGAGGGGFIGLSVATSLSHDSPVLLDVTGGDLTSTCADTLPQSSLNVILGLPGVATSLSPCAAGHAGPFCAACAAGLWGDGQLCRPCATLQGLGFYVARGWPNASCPYQCKRGLPHVKLNPECLSNLRFAISCLGGRLGLVASLLCPVLIFLGARFCRAPPAIQSTSFPSELLPKHSRRIFLPGENSFERPWRVEVLATECSEVVLSRLSEILAVPAWEPVCLFAAWLLCPPLFQLAAYQLRRRRAQKAQALLPGPTASGASASRLGCDGGATLGFLDIFDMERSLVDWAPSLRQEHIFLVRGQGTWSCPWELDVGDPLLLGVAPSQLAPQAAFSLVCAFNRLSRHLARPLTDSDPALRQLQELRRQHLAQVQVFRLRSREVCSSGPTFSDLVRRIPSSTQDAEFRLGLVFSATANPANRFAEREAPLVTPQRPELPEPGPEVATKEETSGDWRRKLASFRFWLLVRCSCPQASFLTMSLVFLILVVFDVMACALMAYSLWALAAPGVLRRWLLLPTPLAPLLAPALGLAALLEGRTPLAQYLHRGHAQLALRSLLNLVPVALVLKAELLLPFCVVLVLNLCTIYAAAAFSVLAAEAADRCAAKAHSAHSAERRAASTQMMVLPPRSQTVSDADPGGFQGVP